MSSLRCRLLLCFSQTNSLRCLTRVPKELACAGQLAVKAAAFAFLPWCRVLAALFAALCYHHSLMRQLLLSSQVCLCSWRSALAHPPRHINKEASNGISAVDNSKRQNMGLTCYDMASSLHRNLSRPAGIQPSQPARIHKFCR